jgi:hypothetical protein
MYYFGPWDDRDEALNNYSDIRKLIDGTGVPIRAEEE